MTVRPVYGAGLPLVLALWCAIPLPAQPADAPALAPHTAVYDMSLTRAEPGGLIAFDGVMTYTLRATCSGWSSTWSLNADVRNQDGAELSTGWDFASFETFDGALYVFSGRTMENGVVVETVDGAVDGETGVSGDTPVATRAVFQNPATASVSLDAGTLFPNAHTLALIDAARQNRTFLATEVFDGGQMDGPVLVTAAIGPAPPTPLPRDVDKALLQGPSWSFSMAYFGTADTAAVEDQTPGVPVYEIHGYMHGNGVTRKIVQDFGSFRVSAKLRSLTPIAPPTCENPLR